MIKNDKIIYIDDVELTVDATDQGGLAYGNKSSYEELNNSLYRDIQDRFNPNFVIDIGANYGFTGIVYGRIFNNAHLTLVEPSKKLCKYIKLNLTQNKISKFNIVNSICGEESVRSMSFAINPLSSQDNRVIGETEKWETITSSVVILSNLISTSESAFNFIKIDTQGYEERVFSGGADYLDSSSNWIIKTEFAPYWLNSQGTDPEDFLKGLVAKYNVCELPTRSRYKGDNIESLLSNKIQISEVLKACKHIQKYNKNGRGWCDLLITPKNPSHIIKK